MTANDDDTQQLRQVNKKQRVCIRKRGTKTGGRVIALPSTVDELKKLCAEKLNIPSTSKVFVGLPGGFELDQDALDLLERDEVIEVDEMIPEPPALPPPIPPAVAVAPATVPEAKSDPTPPVPVPTKTSETKESKTETAKKGDVAAKVNEKDGGKSDHDDDKWGGDDDEEDEKQLMPPPAPKVQDNGGSSNGGNGEQNRGQFIPPSYGSMMSGVIEYGINY
ncbi:hypothetical protein HDU76_013770 [Blyttiomyces sp. JEL0837]|nr:hypothetical protein HDU76_013770 [Blyttiomyces sp. JEL0837]